MDKPEEAYRSAFLPTFTSILCFGIVLGVPGILLVRPGLAIDPAGVAYAILAGAGFGLVLTLLAIICFPVYIGASGLRCYDFWGVYRTVAWTEIRSVRRLNLLGLRYLVMKKEGNGSVFVPLFLSARECFRENVKTYAGGDNPLVRALDRA